MKKLVVLAVLILTSVSMFSQITSQGKPDVLKSFRMGVCKLIDTLANTNTANTTNFFIIFCF